MTGVDESWVPPACTLPTAEQPLRLAEFDDLFASALLAQHRPAPTLLRWQLHPAAEQKARELAERETACCSFFTFTFTSTPGHLQLDVAVPAAYVEVLDALAERTPRR
jgi:hypothetical protein